MSEFEESHSTSIILFSVNPIESGMLLKHLSLLIQWIGASSVFSKGDSLIQPFFSGEVIQISGSYLVCNREFFF